MLTSRFYPDPCGSRRHDGTVHNTRDNVIVVPGIGDSGPDHWQSRWQAREGWTRFAPSSWDEPELEAWVAALDNAVTPGCVLVAHSIGCLTSVTWLARGGSASAALLVAPPDPDADDFPAEARGWSATPSTTLLVPTVVVASTDDPYDRHGYAARAAADWGSTYVEVGAAGHINADSGLGDWSDGFALLSGMLGR